MLLIAMQTPKANTEAIWRLLRDRLAAFLRSRVGDRDIREDLLQEIFLRVHQDVSAIRQPARLEAWVFQIARNVVADYYRKHLAHPAASLDGRGIDPAAEFAGANYHARMAGWLPKMIERLPADQRDAVTMYEFEGCSQQEIAERMGISLSGAKSRIQRGRRRLEAILRECCRFQLDRRGAVIDCQPHVEGGCLAEGCICDE